LDDPWWHIRLVRLAYAGLRWGEATALDLYGVKDSMGPLNQ
jgi:hypothetical protein